MFPRPAQDSLRYSSYRTTKLLLFTVCFLVPSTHALSKGFHSPEECLAYDGDAHLNCLYAYIEVQQDTIVKLESQLHTQQKNSQKLQDDVARQLSLNATLQEGITTRERALAAYRYPPLELYSGFSYRFGRFRSHRRYWGPRLSFHVGPYYPIW